MNIKYVETYIKSLFEKDGLPSYFVIKPLRENVNDPDNIKTIGYSYFMFGFKMFEYKFGKDYILVYETPLSEDIIKFDRRVFYIIINIGVFGPFLFGVCK